MLSRQVEDPQASAAEGLILLAAFLWQHRQLERSRGILERLCRRYPDNIRAECLLGWVVVTQQLGAEDDPVFRDDSELDEALVHFEAVLEQQPKDLLAILGKARVCELTQRIPEALELVTEGSLKYTWFLPFAMERLQLLMRMNNWEQLVECGNDLLKLDNKNLQALSALGVQAITRQGNLKKAVLYVREVMTSINQEEPKNARLYYHMAHVFARLSCQEPQILSFTMGMAEKALRLEPEHCGYVVEVGYQHLMQDNPAKATEMFTSALQMDELNLDANYGALEAHIMSGELQEATTQLAFLEELVRTSASATLKSEHVPEENPSLMYIRGLLAYKQERIPEALAAFEQCIQRHVERASSLPIGMDMFATLWPQRITHMVGLMLQTAGGGRPRAPTEPPIPVLARCTRSLELLLRLAPSLPDAQLLTARTFYLSGNLESAQARVADLLKVNPEDTATQLLGCSILIHQGRPDDAYMALEGAVSSNFAIRETALFHIVHAQVLMAKGKLEEARKVLETAMALPGVRSPLTATQQHRLSKKMVEPSLHERCTVYLLLVEVINKTSKMTGAPEAKKYIADALREFEGTSEEVRVLVVDSEMAVSRGDVEGALQNLVKVPPTSSHFMKARTAMADIYLKHRNDQAAYIRTYMELRDQNPSLDTHCMLGEALLAVMEPELAVEAFEDALMISPKDVELLLKVASTLVTCHEYRKAVEYYKKAIYNSPPAMVTGLQQQLAKLHVRLRQYEEAEALLQKCLKQKQEKTTNLESLVADAETHQLLARVCEGRGDVEAYISHQEKALEAEQVVLDQLRGHTPEVLKDHKKRAADICCELAGHYKKNRRFDKAKELYNSALLHQPGHTSCQLALAKLSLVQGDLEGCQQQCVQLLKNEPNNEEATIMLAELMFCKEHYDSAIFHFQQLLDKQPGHYTALSQLISLLRRSGRMDDVPKYLEKAEATCKGAAGNPGLNYCKGLHFRYLNRPREALTAFNLARRDATWGSAAVLHMAEIYLNPDNDAVWAEQEPQVGEDGMESVQTAKTLLAQVRPNDTSTIRFRVLEAYAKMASKDKSDVEAALSMLLDMANEDPNNVPVLLALATGFMILKQTPKARNQLKRVQKLPYRSEEAEEFERAWLLLADIYISGGKYDLAQELCQRCLRYNKSCAKAWEMLGGILEREQTYNDAADHYVKAWKFESQSSPQVGFKLAFNYLKAKRAVEAIDICQQVLKEYPEYPKIRKEVLDKARQLLRP